MLSFLERIMGIEPTSTAWEAVVLPMNYIRIFVAKVLYQNFGKMSRQENAGVIGLYPIE